MSRAQQIGAALMPWAGLVIGFLALAVVHQYGSDATFDDCIAASPGPVFVVAVIGLLVCAGSGLVSWRSYRGSDSEIRRVVSAISVGSAALFMFSIVLAMAATLVLPPCFA